MVWLRFSAGKQAEESGSGTAAHAFTGLGGAVRGSSVEELAGKMEVDPSVLKATVEQYNGFCEKGRDEFFAKDPKYLLPLKGPRYYAVRARTGFLGTLGGIRINSRTEVVDRYDVPIPGLYAAGNDAGGLHAESYSMWDTSGIASGFAINSGRIAGENAVRYLTSNALKGI